MDTTTFAVNDAEGDVKRRSYLTSPGEPLLSALSPIETSMRLSIALEEWGLSPSEVLPSSYVSLPIPIAPQQWPEGRRRWAGTNAESMWHPLLWLPRRLAHTATITVNGEQMRETEDMWAARVAIELTESGLYDKETGLWADVLDLHGIDIDTDEGKRRVQEWLDGGEDAVLSAIDLTPYLDVESDVNWASRVVLQQWSRLQVVCWGVTAGTCVQAVDDIADLVEEGRGDQVQGQLSMVALAASNAFADFDDNGAEHDYWLSVHNHIQGLQGAPQDIIEAVSAPMRARLVTLRDAYMPAVEDIARGEQNGDGPRHAADEADPFAST